VTSAFSNQVRASWSADRPAALRPACRRYCTAFSCMALPGSGWLAASAEAGRMVGPAG
jgi:hypothetical protein